MSSANPDNIFFEAAVVEGLEAVSWEEIRHRFGSQARLLVPAAQIPGVLQFAFDGNLHKLTQLKTVLSLFQGERFPVPRPKALLGHQNLQNILSRVKVVRELWARTAFRTLHLAAAGADSSVMTRLSQEIARDNNLEITREEGDLLVRVRRPLQGGEYWEVLVRLSPRPLSTRDWRMCDLKGGLNAAAAHALVALTRPSANDVFLNVGFGSGTLLIERAARGPFAAGTGLRHQPRGAGVRARKHKSSRVGKTHPPDPVGCARPAAGRRQRGCVLRRPALRSRCRHARGE
jgi:tRNA (guanine6-N2)-methyltransferase